MGRLSHYVLCERSELIHNNYIYTTVSYNAITTVPSVHIDIEYCIHIIICIDVRTSVSQSMYTYNIVIKNKIVGMSMHGL